MVRKNTILVMAGAREAHSLIAALVGRQRRVIASLPEPERMFDDFPVVTRVGRFETGAAFASLLDAEAVGSVIDASHSFDADFSDIAAHTCRRIAIRYLRVLRPAWRAGRNDIWRSISNIALAVRDMPSEARVFANTGWPSLPDYAGFPGERVFMRQTLDHTRPPPYKFVEFVSGTPPFSQFQEQALFGALRISHLICRNTGGAASMSKLLAARSLRLPVYMVERKLSKLQHPVVGTVAEALAWEAA